MSSFFKISMILGKRLCRIILVSIEVVLFNTVLLRFYNLFVITFYGETLISIIGINMNV